MHDTNSGTSVAAVFAIVDSSAWGRYLQSCGVTLESPEHPAQLHAGNLRYNISLQELPYVAHVLHSMTKPLIPTRFAMVTSMS